jgi:hypothetical protein
MNHLLVGLGGTGGKVLGAFRRLVFEQYREVEPVGLNLDYLYIDSSKEDTNHAKNINQLKEGDQLWRTLGQSVQLSPAQVVYLEQGSFAHVIDNIEDYPTYGRWLGDISVWRDIWNSAPNGIEAGGQLRRFGRFLFAQNNKQVVEALQDRFASAGKLRGGVAEAGWTVHVIAGLAGGTGSGTIIDLVGQLRRMRADRDTRIVVYAVLPDVEDTSWAKENYYANGYAALAELNGLLVRTFKPADVRERGSERYNSERPIDNVFLVTNRNNNGLIVSLEQVVPEVIAETMFQIIVTSGDARARGHQDANAAGGDQRVWRDMVSGENYFGGYDKDAATGPDARANRFLSFGIKRVAIPAQEIREFATLAFVRQSMLQLVHNNWSEGSGFIDEPASFDPAALVRADESRENWRLTDEHLMLERRMLDGDSQDWRHLLDEFLNPLNTKANIVREQVRNNDQWLQPVDEFAAERFDRGFRKVGVPEFYRVAERSAPDRARHIRDRIANDLFERWASGQHSARHTQRVLDELVIDLQERLGAADRKVQENKRLETERDGDRKRLFNEYASFGGRGSIVGPLTYSRPQALSKYVRILSEMYAANARQLAFAYSKRMITLVLAEVQGLLADVQIVADRLTRAAEIAQKRQASRVPINEESDDRAHLYKFYDKARVRSVVRRLELNTDVQHRQTAGMRAELVKLLGSKPSFKAFVEQLSEWRLIEQLERQAETNAEEEIAAQDSPNDHILEGSIFQSLYDKYGGNEEELKRFIGERVAEAGSFAPFSIQEQAAPGTTSGPPATQRKIVAFIPAAEELPEALRSFRDQFARIAANADQNAPTVVEVRGRPHEIVFLSLVNNFPLRYLQALEHLKQNYDSLVGGPNAKRKKLELHLEGDGSDLPSLYVRLVKDVRKDAAPYWLIADCAELIKERKNPATGQPEVYAVIEDEDGQKSAVVFGKELAAGSGALTPDAAPSLRLLVDQLLRRTVHIDDRNELKAKLIKRQNDALEAAAFNEADPSFQTVRETVIAARRVLGV